MRFTVKTSAGLLAAALALTACGGTKGGDNDTASGNGGAGSCDNLAIGYFGALTGPAANLGINIRNGVKLAVDKHNKDNPDCKVDLKEYDSAGDPNQATGLATQAIGELSGQRPEVSFEGWRTGDQRYYVTDARKLEAATGWRPRVNVRQGVSNLYNWWLETAAFPAAAEASKNGVAVVSHAP